jgi:hypothetical protein
MQVRKVSWEEEAEPWTEQLGLHSGPTVDLTFEERHGFLLVCSLTFQKQTTPPLPHETGPSTQGTPTRTLQKTFLAASEPKRHNLTWVLLLLLSWFALCVRACLLACLLRVQSC